MAKIGEKSKRRRTTEQMAKDIAIVLNSNTLSYGAKFDVIHGVTWQWTQRNGIHRGNSLWSQKAIDLYLREHVKTSLGNLGKIFREEHIVPRTIIIDHLFKLNKPIQWEYVYQYLNKYLKSIVLTIKENKEINDIYKAIMPEHIDITINFDEWARYRHSSIAVKYIKWKSSGKTLIVEDILDYLN